MNLLWFFHSDFFIQLPIIFWKLATYIYCLKIKSYYVSITIFPLIFQVPVWSFSSAGAKIIHMLAKPTEEVVHSQGRVMADRSVLFKYINPNLAFVLAEGQDTTGKGFVNIYLLDLVTGRIIFSANHRRVQVMIILVLI